MAVTGYGGEQKQLLLLNTQIRQAVSQFFVSKPSVSQRVSLSVSHLQILSVNTLFIHSVSKLSVSQCVSQFHLYIQCLSVQVKNEILISRDSQTRLSASKSVSQ